MRAIKVYNNNAVSSVTRDGREVVAIGTGIGFRKRPGDRIDERRIEKLYYVQDDLQTKFLQLLKDARPEALQASEEILAHARKEGLELKDQLLLSLTDHISFALERYEQKIELPYLMLSETRMLYPKEYEIGKWSLEEIRMLCGVRLPEYEAGYIALQLASSSMNKEVTYNTLKFVKESLDIVKDTYEVTLDPDQINTLRLTTHLKFLAQRIFTHAQWNDQKLADLKEILVVRHRKNQECIDRLRAYIQNHFDYSLNEQEEVYLLVHLNQIFDR